jgi:hypothetical protein
MPRPWAVEVHVLQLNSSKRETPQGKPVASEDLVLDSCSSKREVTTGQARGIFDLCKAVSDLAAEGFVSFNLRAHTSGH